MPQAIGSAIIGEIGLATGIELAVGTLAESLVGYVALTGPSLGATFTAISEEAARDGAERDPAA